MSFNSKIYKYYNTSFMLTNVILIDNKYDNFNKFRLKKIERPNKNILYGRLDELLFYNRFLRTRQDLLLKTLLQSKISFRQANQPASPYKKRLKGPNCRLSGILPIPLE